ncbi:ABC transporter isoform A [Pycnococcus provasolii]
MAGWFRGAVVSRGFSLLLDDSDDLDDVLGEEDNSISSSFRRVSRGGDDDDGGASSSRVELSPEELASVASRWTFSWVNPLVALGATKALQHDDLWPTTMQDEPNEKATYFSRRLARRTANGKCALFWAIWDTYKAPFVRAGLYKFGHDCLQFLSPVILRYFLLHIEAADTSGGHDSSHGIAKGVGLAVALYTVNQLQTLTVNQYFHILFRLQLHLKTGLIAAVFAKASRLTGGVVRRLGVGTIINYQSNDTSKIYELPPYAHVVWSGPFQIITSLGYLIYVVGFVPAFAGVLAMFVLMPVSKRLVEKMQSVRKELLRQTDARVKLCTESIGGVKTIKLYSWEVPYLRRIRELRALEIAEARRSVIYNSIMTFLFVVNPILVAVTTFTAFACMGKTLTPSVAFTALSLFNNLRFPLMMFPRQIAQIIQANVSVGRLARFFVEEEKAGGTDAQSNEELEKQITSADPTNEVGVVGTFKWSSKSNWIKEQERKREEAANAKATKAKPSIVQRMRSLRDKLRLGTSRGGGIMDMVDEDEGTSIALPEDEVADDRFALVFDEPLAFKRGSLTVVIGEVGSGKTTLLASLLGELHDCHDELAASLRGRLHLKGRIAYTAQDPWIQNATVRDNILCGREYNADRYNRVIEACSLSADLQALPAGEMTEIGEKGVNLSGGQKHRVALARACYLDGDVVMLDDPLSAVDAHVGKHLFEQCICTFLAGKTRILVTHQLQFTSAADTIVVMRGGRVFARGTFDELKDVDEIRRWLEESHGGVNADDGGDDAEVAITADESNAAAPAPAPEKLAIFDRSVNAAVKDKSAEKGQATAEQGAKSTATEGRLVQKEERAEGSVDSGIYMRYIRAFGAFIPPALLLLYTCVQAFSIGKDYWLAVWSSSVDRQSSFGYYLGVYAGISIVFCVTRFMQSLAMVYGSLRAAAVLHDNLLTTVFHLPMKFFDTQPTGRLINRFTKDTESIDLALPASMQGYLFCVTTAVFQIAIVMIITPAAIVAIAPIAYWYRIVQNAYISSSREIKRLDSIARSPIFNHFGETVAGLSTIRAFGLERQFIHGAVDKLAYSNRASFAFPCLNRWLSVRIESMGNAIVLAAALGIATLHRDLVAGLAGLVLSNSVAITGLLSWMVRQSGEVENEMNSVERVTAYDEVEPEAPWIIAEHRPPYNWPQRGSISVERLCVQYRPDLPLVLRDVTFHVAGGEDVGICGRTGCGKSTLVLALFRITEPLSGSIRIDGIDTGAIGLRDLRKNLSFVPQDPVLFSGTIRSNLDPFDEFASHKLLEALEEVGMKEQVTNLGGLDFEVKEQGANLSTGQRQLLCLSRALLRAKKVLVMDEATSNIDHNTDALIQNTIRTRFAEATTLTIAHRLHTISDGDKILVLEKGEVLEFDSPEKLLGNSAGAFARMMAAARRMKNSSSANLLNKM